MLTLLSRVCTFPLPEKYVAITDNGTRILYAEIQHRDSIDFVEIEADLFRDLMNQLGFVRMEDE